MTDALPLPMRILVKGASTVNWSSPMGGPRTDFTFPRAMEQALLAKGYPVDIRTHSLPSELTSGTLPTWQREVLGFSPDVIVLVYGHYETIHLFLPRWFERHANSMRSRPRSGRDLYRRAVLRPTWKAAARLQSKVDGRLDPTMRSSRPSNVAADLETLIGRYRTIASPLVFVFELLPPAPRYTQWFPGMEARMAVMNRTLEDMVNRIGDPDVRFFRTSELVQQHLDGEILQATPDGFHYTPFLHGKIGAALAEEVRGWAQTQDHLALPDA